MRNYPIYMVDDSPFSFLRSDGSFGEYDSNTVIFSQYEAAAKAVGDKYGIHTLSLSIDDSEEGRQIKNADQAIRILQTT